ncbi:MAG: signal peptide peptidase SppA [Phycisphaerae bacterium]
MPPTSQGAMAGGGPRPAVAGGYGGYGYGPPPGAYGGTGYGGPGYGGPGLPPPYPYMSPPATGGGWKVATVLLLLLALGSLALNLILIVAVAAVGGSETDGIIVQTLHDGSGQTVAVVPVTGLILNETYEQFDRFMDRAQRDGVAAVVIEIDSPGGAVTPSDLIFRRIEKFKADTGTPVVVSMGSLAASGGYYAAVAGDSIWANETTITGSIGVILPLYNASELGQKLGIADDSIVSTGARYKDAGSLLKQMDDESRVYLQDLIDEQFGLFKQVVAAGRGAKLKRPINDLADGRVYGARAAMQYGLVDNIGTLEDAIADAAGRAGELDPTVVRYKAQPTLLDLLGGGGVNGGTPGGVKGTLEAGWPSVTIDPALIWELTTPRPMYLWRGQ